MSKLKPIGSEKLSGEDKFKRIMEIARFNETIPNVVNETSRSEYSISLADGNNYQIVKERQGYIIKKTISESETDYIEPMKNRKYYTSYSQALKRLNLVAGELNRINENEEGVSLYGEQKKFVLKTPKPAPEAAPAPAPPAAPPAVPSPELPPSPVGADVELGAESDDLGAETGTEDLGGINDDMGMGGNEEEKITFKTIQKLTGKLTQKVRTLTNEEGMTSEDIKYVINMVLSSLDLGNLSDEDKEDILSKIEGGEEEDGGDEMGGEDMGDEEVGGEEMGTEETPEVEPSESEMYEGNIYGSFDDKDGWFDEKDTHRNRDFDFDYDEEEFNDFDLFMDKYGDKTKWFNDDNREFAKARFDDYKKHYGKPLKVRTRKGPEDTYYSSTGYDFLTGLPISKDKQHLESDHGAIFDSIFGESKVDKVISSYFEKTKKEILENKEKKSKHISEVKSTMKNIIKLTKTIEQELASKKFLEENKGFKFIGKTNKNNLVFESASKQIKISPEGFIL